MSEETKKQPETEQEQAAAETKAPAAESDKQEAEPAAEKTEKKDWFGKKSKAGSRRAGQRKAERPDAAHRCRV